MTAENLGKLGRLPAAVEDEEEREKDELSEEEEGGREGDTDKREGDKGGETERETM